MHDFRGTQLMVGVASQNSEAAQWGQVKDFVNKYVKDPVLAATTGNLDGTYSAGVLTLTSSLTTLDGITLNTDDRILVKDQTDTTQNGIYVYTDSTTLTRSEDFKAASIIMNNTTVSVMQGTDNADTKWVLVSDGVLTVDTSNIIFVKDGSNDNGIKLAKGTITGDGVKTSFDIAHNFNLTDPYAYKLTLKDSTGNYIYCSDVPTTSNESNSITCTFSTAPELNVTYKAFIVGLE